MIYKSKIGSLHVHVSMRPLLNTDYYKVHALFEVYTLLRLALPTCVVSCIFTVTKWRPYMYVACPQLPVRKACVHASGRDMLVSSI